MPRRYRFDDIEIDLDGFRLLKAGDSVAIEPKALNLLIFLVENRGRLVSRRELIDAVWNGAFVTDHVLNRAIGQLRRQLADDPKAPRYVETVPTLGYRFIATVASETAEDTPSAAVNAPIATPQSSVAAPANTVERESMLPGSEPARPVRAATRVARGRVIAAGAALGLLLGVAIFWMVRGSSRRGVRPIQSLAVLPLENLSGDASQQYLADGMTDQLINSLGQISALRVISRTTAMQYKNAHKPLPQIARELNVDAVVEGSVLLSGDKVRITAQLVQAPEEKQLWTHVYEGDMRDVLGLQSQVATAVAEQIRIKVTSREQTELADSHDVDPRAYEALLKGNYFFRQNTQETSRKALDYFHQAIAIDPELAPAYVGIAACYNMLGQGDVPAGEATAAADSAVAKALELQPELSQAYAERAWTLLYYHWDFPGAERDFRHALELNPSSSDAHEGYGMYQLAMGQFDQSVDQMRKARELNPLSPFLLTDFCFVLNTARRRSEAETECLAALELDPHFHSGLWATADTYLDQGKYAKAHEFIAETGDCDAACEAMADEIHGAPGKSGAFDSWLKAQKVNPDASVLASAYAGLGRKDEAFAALEKCYEERCDPHGMTYTAVDPHYDSLRSDPRFDAFLRRVGLPPQPHLGSATDRASNP